jgi:hypothetical protein
MRRMRRSPRARPVGTGTGPQAEHLESACDEHDPEEQREHAGARRDPSCESERDHDEQSIMATLTTHIRQSVARPEAVNVNVSIAFSSVSTFQLKNDRRTPSG